jgi:hypothetical protein
VIRFLAHPRRRIVMKIWSGLRKSTVAVGIASFLVMGAASLAVVPVASAASANSAVPARHHHAHVNYYNITYYNISVDSYCKWAFGPQASADLRSYQGNPANAGPDAWFCVGVGSTQGTSNVDLNSWCAHLNEGHAVLIANSAYGWRCTQPKGPAVRLVG